MKDVSPYLTFDGDCRQAMEFYEKALDAQLHLVRFGDVPGDFPKEAADRIMHARLTKGSAALMASDTMPGKPFHPGNNFSLSIGCESAEETDKLFNAMAEGGKITMPLQQTFWAPRFGMLTDRFGINWMFNFETTPQG